MSDSSLTRTASWIIRDRHTKRVICETWLPEVVAGLNLARYEAVPILTYLQEVNAAIKAADATK